MAPGRSHPAQECFIYIQASAADRGSTKQTKSRNSTNSQAAIAAAPPRPPPWSFRPTWRATSAPSPPSLPVPGALRCPAQFRPSRRCPCVLIGYSADWRFCSISSSGCCDSRLDLDRWSRLQEGACNLFDEISGTDWRSPSRVLRSPSSRMLSHG